MARSKKSWAKVCLVTQSKARAPHGDRRRASTLRAVGDARNSLRRSDVGKVCVCGERTSTWMRSNRN